MNAQVSTAIVDPDDPFFKDLRHRYYRLGLTRRRKLLEGFYSIPNGMIFNRVVEKEYLLQLAQEGKLIDLLHQVEESETEAQRDSESGMRPQDQPHS